MSCRQLMFVQTRDGKAVAFVLASKRYKNAKVDIAVVGLPPSSRMPKRVSVVRFPGYIAMAQRRM
jgi:hypothetical protein